MLMVAMCSGELSVPPVSIDPQVYTSPHLLNEVEGKAVGAPHWVPVLLTSKAKETSPTPIPRFPAWNRLVPPGTVVGHVEFHLGK